MITYADAMEASALALQAWFRHVERCGECMSVSFGGHICSTGRMLKNEHDDALHAEIHAELVATGRTLADCGECEEGNYSGHGITA